MRATTRATTRGVADAGRASGARRTTKSTRRIQRSNANANANADETRRAVTRAGRWEDEKARWTMRDVAAVVASAALAMSSVGDARAEEAGGDASAETLDAATLYARAVEDSEESVAPALEDDKDLKEFESWNWRALVGAGADANDGGSTKTKTKTKTKTSAPSANGPSDATLRAQQKREENAARLAKVQAEVQSRDSERQAKLRAQIKERDAAAMAAVEARRAAQRELLQARARQAKEETAAARARRDAQRERMEALRSKTPEEKEAELEAFRNRDAPSPYAAKSKRSTAKKSYAAKKSGSKVKATAKPKPAAAPAQRKKYSGALDRNSFRNVKKQEYGAGAAPFAFIGLCAFAYYLLLQEEDD